MNLNLALQAEDLIRVPFFLPFHVILLLYRCIDEEKQSGDSSSSSIYSSTIKEKARLFEMTNRSLLLPAVSDSYKLPKFDSHTENRYNQKQHLPDVLRGRRYAIGTRGRKCQRLPSQLQLVQWRWESLVGK